LDASNIDSGSATVEGNVSLGKGNFREASVDYWFEYRQSNVRDFNEGSTDNGDNITADGDYLSSPYGYAHDNDYVHDNRPISDGENRTYYVNTMSCGCTYDGTIRDSEYTSPDGTVNNIAEADNTGDIREFVGDGERLEIEAVHDGDEFRVYLDGDLINIWSDVGGYNELFYSSYEWGGSLGEDSLRLTDVYDGGSGQIDDTGVEQTGEDGFVVEDLTALESNQGYQFRPAISWNPDDRGIWRSFTTAEATSVEISLVSPQSGFDEAGSNQDLTAEINSGSEVNASFYDASDDGLISYVEDQNSGDLPDVTWTDLEPDNLYEWYVNGSDSEAWDVSETRSFTTYSTPDRPFNPVPGDEVDGVLLDSDLEVSVSHPDNLDSDIEFFLREEGETGWDGAFVGSVNGVEPDGTAVLDSSEFTLEEDMNYEWKANASAQGFTNSSEVWRFDTVEVIEVNVDPVFGDSDNLNNGSADVGSSILEFDASSGDTDNVEEINLSVDGDQVWERNNEDLGSFKFDISSENINQDRSSVG